MATKILKLSLPHFNIILMIFLKFIQLKKNVMEPKLYLLQHGHQNLESTCFTTNFEKEFAKDILLGAVNH